MHMGAEQIQAAWNEIAEGYDAVVTSTHSTLAEEGLRRAGLRRGNRFLDVAAGTGALSIPAARLGADVLATDLSPRMLERLEARARTEGLQVETGVMNGEALELEADRFDVAGSQFGVMLFSDMPKGVRELARVVRPGGRVLLTVFGDPRKVEFFVLFVRAIRAVRPDFSGPSMDDPPLPFQLRDPERLREELSAAGLHDVTAETVTEPLRFPNGRALWDWLLGSNPIVKSVLGSLNLNEEERGAIPAELDTMLRERPRENEAAVVTNQVHIGVGVK